MVYKNHKQTIHCHPLLAALQSGNIHLVEYLVKDCEVQVHQCFYHEYDGEEQTCRQRYDALTLMLSSLDLDMHDNLLTYVMTRLSSHDAINAPIVTDNFSDKDHENWYDLTYLQYFARERNARVCELLLRHGADSKRKNEARGLDSIELWPELAGIVESTL